MTERFTGALLGLAVGDALGAPAEHLTAAQIRRKFGHLTEMVGGGWLNLAPGETTDETDQMLLTAESLLAVEGFDKVDLTRRFLSWYASDPVDIGNTTEAALQRFSEGRLSVGADAVDTGFSGTSGALVRAVPIALAFRQSPERVCDHARAAARITHNNPNAQWATALIGIWVKLACDGSDDFLAEGLSRLPFNGFAVDLPRRPVATTQALDVVRCVYWAVRKCSSFDEAVTSVIQLGGDTDNVAALTGAVAGACFGAQAIPDRWVECLRCRDRVRGMAEGLLRLSLHLGVVG